MAEKQFIKKRKSNPEDLSGRRFGSLTVKSMTRDDDYSIKWVCVCDCGRQTIVFGGNLRRGLSKSCGCIGIAARTKYDKAKRSEYRTWHAARQRCIDPNNRVFSIYGGRGITMCDQWIESFDKFFEDMGPRPPGMSLDRIDNDGPYSPQNCRWATNTQQQDNRRVTIFATHNGETLPLTEWARRSGERYSTLIQRFRRGIPIFERRRKRRF